jgi:hypothetical protein
MTLHRITTAAFLRTLKQATTLQVSLSPDRYRQLARFAAMEGDTPDQAVRKMIDDYCTDVAPAGRWSTEPMEFKPKPRSARV